MTPEMREILARVAAGELDPAEASRLLAAGSEAPLIKASDAERERVVEALGDALADGRLDPDEHQQRVESAYRARTRDELLALTSDLPRSPLVDDAADAGHVRVVRPTRDEPTGVAPGSVGRVAVVCGAQSVRVVADPTVSTVSVEGPHVLRQEGDRVVVEAGPMAGRPGPGAFRFEGPQGPWWRWLGQMGGPGLPTTVRVRPDLAVELVVSAGAGEVAGLRGPLRLEVNAGSGKVVDCDGPFDVQVRTGSAKLQSRLVSGRSRVRVDLGEAVVDLQPGSDVTVTGGAELGDAVVKGPTGTVRLGQDAAEVRVGDGHAELEVSAVMGSVKVRVPA